MRISRRVVGRIYGMKYSCKGHKDIKTEENAKTDCKQWASWAGLCQRHTPQRLHHVRVSQREKERGGERKY